jgi:membrane protease YdiL (CAAX protease family)
MRQRSSFNVMALVLYVVIAYGIVWLLIGISTWFKVPFTPLLIVGSWAPNIAAFLVIGLVLRERHGIRSLLARWLRWRFAAFWYLAALSAVVLALLSLALFLVVGGRLAAAGSLTVGTVLSLVVIEIVTGATGEELGWRGFLQLRLQEKLAPLPASLVVGVIWAAFHLPLWTVPGGPWASIPFWSFALAAVSASVIFAWLVNGAGGSMVIATIFHFLFNVASNIIIVLGVPIPSFYAIYALLFTAFAVVVAVAGAVSRARRGAGTPARAS